MNGDLLINTTNVTKTLADIIGVAVRQQSELDALRGFFIAMKDNQTALKVCTCMQQGFLLQQSRQCNNFPPWHPHHYWR
jgi:hypothetical protein